VLYMRRDWELGGGYGTLYFHLEKSVMEHFSSAKTATLCIFKSETFLK